MTLKIYFVLVSKKNVTGNEIGDPHLLLLLLLLLLDFSNF